MYEKYPISGIKQSYNHTSETKTVIMPLLITALVVGLAVFYFKGDPTQSAPDSVNVASVEPEVATDTVSETSGSVDSPQVGEPTLPVREKTQSPELLNNTEDNTVEEEAVNVSSTASDERSDILANATGDGFTPWMQPSELDAYIRSQAEGSAKSFWEKGHWITAVEGRWGGEAHEFRIAVDSIPDIDSWQWKYRVDLTEDQFAAQVTEMLSKGYSLVHTQTYALPDQSRRFQGVWHKQIEVPSVASAQPEIEAAPVAEPTVDIATSANAAASSVLGSPAISNDSRALDVNRLQFR